MGNRARAAAHDGRKPSQAPQRLNAYGAAITKRRERGELVGMLTWEEARVRLGVSRGRMSKLLKLGATAGGIASHPSPTDERVKLIAVADVERFLQITPSAEATAAWIARVTSLSTTSTPQDSAVAAPVVE